MLEFICVSVCLPSISLILLILHYEAEHASNAVSPTSLTLNTLAACFVEKGWLCVSQKKGDCVLHGKRVAVCVIEKGRLCVS